jgi:tetratricopeptide (TPR) repeat protein
MPTRLEQLLKFHAMDPADAFCAYGIAMEYLKVGQTDEGLSWLDKTLAINGDYAYAYYQKAKTLGERGDKAAAQAAVKAGIEAATRSGDGHAAGELMSLGESL